MTEKTQMSEKEKKGTRVLHVVGSLNRGGVETWLVALFRELESSGGIQNEVMIQTPAGPKGYSDEVKGAGVSVHLIRRGIRWPLELYKFLKAESGFDVVHSHRNEFGAFVLLIALLARVPIRIAHSHSDRRPSESRVHALYRHICRWLLRFSATDQIGVSEDARESLFGSNLSRSRVIYCGLDLDSYRFDSDARFNVQSRLGISESATAIVHVGGFRPVKNHRFLLNVFMAVNEISEEPVHLILVGDGELRSAISDVAADLGVKDYVHFLGVRDDVPEILSASDVFVFPSLFEGLGLAIVEAQANGLPCVISDTISSEAVVSQSLVTRLSLNRSEKEWAAEVLRMARLREPNSTESEILKRFDIRDNAAAMLQLYGGPEKEVAD